MGTIYLEGICYSSGGGGGGASSADQVSLDDTNLAYEADDVQEAFEKVTKSLTYAEYQELTEEEKNNGTIYLITDVNGDGQSFQPVIYSEEEREIGVWTDGKPIYQKTLTCTTDTNIGPDNWTTMPWDEEPENIDFLVTGQNHQGDVPNSYATVRVAYTGGHLKMAAIYSSTFGAGKQFTVWYTKTTDTAGSGTWTPQGVPAVHYSTEEQIVGTWIDGSTLYEKTFFLSQRTPITNDYTTYIIDDTTIYDIDNIISCDIFDNNSDSVPLTKIAYLERAVDVIKSNNKLIAFYNTNNTYKTTGFILRYTKSST